MLFTLTPAAMPVGYGDGLVSLAAAKEWLRVTSDDEDALIEALRDGAIEAVERYANVRLGPVTGLVATFDGFDRCAPMRLGVGPEASVVVTGVSYVGSDGVAIAMDDGDWRVDAAGGLIPVIGARWPTGYGTVAVTFSAGFPSGTCPASLILAVKMTMAFLYSNREGVLDGTMEFDVPPGAASFCDRFRMPVL